MRPPIAASEVHGASQAEAKRVLTRPGRRPGRVAEGRARQQVQRDEDDLRLDALRHDDADGDCRLEGAPRTSSTRRAYTTRDENILVGRGRERVFIIEVRADERENDGRTVTVPGPAAEGDDHPGVRRRSRPREHVRVASRIDSIEHGSRAAGMPFASCACPRRAQPVEQLRERQLLGGGPRGRSLARAVSPRGLRTPRPSPRRAPG